VEFVNEKPHVLIVGGGHGGVHIVARLKRLGNPTPVVERNARIGDNWRNGCDALRLHYPVRKSWDSANLPIIVALIYCLSRGAQQVPGYTVPVRLAGLYVFETGESLNSTGTCTRADTRL